MKNAFCTFIYGNYDRFIPYYLLGIELHYPNAAVIILLDKKLPDKYSDLVKSYPQLILIEDAIDNSTWLKKIKHRGAARQSLRHILQLEVFNQFDTIYFGDVDIIHLDEGFNLFDFHLNQAKTSGVPFSNKVRALPNHPNKSSGRLTGLHFVKVKEYYEKMNPIISAFKNDEAFQLKILKDTERNEHVLFNLCQAAFNFDADALLNNKRPWHGFHLGLVRGRDYLDIQTINENSSIDVESLRNQLKQINKNNTVNKLLLKYECAEVYYTYKYLDLKMPLRVTMKYEILEKRKHVIKFLKRVKQEFCLAKKIARY